MIIKINIDKIKSKGKASFDKLWYSALTSMIKDTNNQLYSDGIVDDKFYLVSTNKQNPVLLRVPTSLTILDQIPHTSYQPSDSDAKQFKDKYVDFRFQLLFAGHPEQYKRFFNAYSRGEGVFALLSTGVYIRIKPNSITKVTKSKITDASLILPKQWKKHIKVISKD